MINKKVKYKLAEFEFPLPEKYISQHPSQRRDHAKLMVLHKDTKKIEHRKIFNISDYIRKNDLIFWKGHVAVAISKSKLIHAYGPFKKVVIMSINKTINKTINFIIYSKKK